jgi:L-iditol 2-dehydrogenase
MLTAYLIKPGTIELRETDIPVPSNSEVLVKIRAALTCGTDLKAYLRGHPMIPMPGLFGHEFSGIVAAAGRGVKKFKEGDAVMAVHSAPCLQCIYCKKRLYNLCENIMHTKILGAFAEYILLPQHIVKQNLFHKPAHLSFEEAAFLEPVSCVVHGMRGLKIKKGDKILIFGSGPIGILHALIAKLKGAEVLICARKRDGLILAKKLGADAIATPDELHAETERFTRGIGFDYVFECTGQVEVWESSIKYARKGATIVLFGGCKKGTSASYDTYRLHYDEITLKGVFHFMPADVKTAFELLSEKINVSLLISGKYALKDLQTAFERLSKGEGIKYAILP